jgi:hypothetical protein
VKFFSDKRQWLPSQAPRSDHHLALKRELWRKRDGWKWAKEYNVVALQDLRKGFLAKYDYTPRYKFGVQIPISHALRLDKPNGKQEAFQRKWINWKNTRPFEYPPRRRTSPSTNKFLTTWFLIVNSMDVERGDWSLVEIIQLSHQNPFIPEL